MKEMKYKSRFELPIEVADYVCAIAKLCKMSPDECLASLIVSFARSHPEVSEDVWKQAKVDNRGLGWTKWPDPPPK